MRAQMDDLKKKFLELLETDEEFRFAVMNMIGVLAGIRITRAIKSYARSLGMPVI
ncbi:MAG: hypothetical protein ACP5NY_07000 [Thermocladium sp.]